MKNGSYATYGQENYKNGKREREREREDRKRERESNVLSRLTFNSILLLSYKMLLSCDTQCVKVNMCQKGICLIKQILQNPLFKFVTLCIKHSRKILQIKILTFLCTWSGFIF